MIIGLGIDLAGTEFWSQAYEDPTTSVIAGTFTTGERADADAGPVPPGERLAARFAAKEAFTKAVSSSRFGQSPMAPRFNPLDIEVVKDDWHRPQLRLHGEAARVADELGVNRGWLTITHEGPYAMAVVVLERD